MPNFIHKSELARQVEADPTTVRRACQPGGQLEPALSRDRTRIDMDHEAARAYVSRMKGRRRGRKRKAPESAATRARLMLEKSREGFSGGSVEAPGGDTTPPLGADAKQALADIRLAGEGRLPDGLEDLGSLTLRQVVERCGDLDGLSAAVKALKDYAQMRNQEGIASKRRGELIDRKLVPSVFVPLVSTAFKRLVEEAPDAMTNQVISRVMSGGDDLRIDVTEIYRREIGTILTACIDAMAKAVEDHTQ